MQLDSLTTATARSSAGAPTSAPQPVPTPAASASIAARAVPNAAQMQAAVAHLNEALREHNDSLQFEIDDVTGKTIVRVVDKDTNEVIRQFPSEEVLAIARAIPPISGALIRDTV